MMTRLYRFLTEEDTSAFCHKVTKALSEGWELYGNPSYTFDSNLGQLRCGQAVTKVIDAPYDPNKRLAEQ